MKILVTGATGFVGIPLVNSLLTSGHEVRVLSRNVSKAKSLLPDKVEVLQWKAPYNDLPQGAFLGVDGLINLMGENIGGKRWSSQQKKKLSDSRILATEKIAKAVQRDLPQGLKSVVSTSAIGYYPVNNEKIMSESQPCGSGFLSTLCKEWEEAAQKIKSQRTVIIRVGIILGKGGGALAKLLPIFKLGLGGSVMPGNQVMSWIHLDDHVRLYTQAIYDTQYRDIINAVAPNPVSNTIFSKALGKAISRPSFLPVPSFALKLAMGEMATIVLDSQYIVSTKLGNLGFNFDYPDIQKALENL